MPSDADPTGTAAPAASRPVYFVKKVGRGKTLSQDLSREESREAFSLLLEGAFTATQFGAFLQALRIKELTQDELDGLAEVFYARMRRREPLGGRNRLVLNLASDTARKGGMVSLLAARILPRFGVGAGLVRSAPVLSGNTRSFDATWESAEWLEKEILPPAPKVPLEAASTGSAARIFVVDPVLVEDLFPKVVDCATLVPGYSALDGWRKELGFRSCLHTAEKLLNPWPGAPMLLGISHRHYARRLAETMVSRGLEGKIVLGNHGTVDLVLHKPTELFSVTGGEIREETLAPADLGLQPSPDVYTQAKFPAWREWLSGPKDGGLWQAVHYHLAFFLWAAGASPDVRTALAAMRAGIPTLFQGET